MAPRPPLERLKARPKQDEWDDDELLSLAEAAALFFPRGPLTVASLRIACQRGELACVQICGKGFTTPRALREMTAPKRTGDLAILSSACGGAPFTS